MKIKLILLTLLVSSFAQAREYTDSQLLKMKPKVIYACPSDASKDFELHVLNDEVITTNKKGVYHFENRGNTEILFRSQTYWALKVTEAFMKGSQPKIDVVAYNYDSSWIVSCYRLSR
ncbi:hypothetical protein D3C87_1540420 [compost metagenome]